MFLTRMYRLPWKIVTRLMVLLVLCKALFDLFATLLLQLTAAMFGDALTYFALGRALLNGFTLYQDIYDTKPPGIYLLSATSLAITGNETLANIAQVIALLLIAVCIVAIGWNEVRSALITVRRTALLFSIFFGLILTQYTALRSGYLQTESFGAAACLAYALILARHAAHFRTRHILLASLCMAIAVGMKEPFLLTLCATAMLFCPSPRSFFRAYLLPALLAAVLGILTLSALGTLRAYLAFSLPEVLFGSYIFAHISPWIGTFNLLPIIRDAWQFSPAFLFLIALTMLSPILLADPEHRPGTITAALTLLLLPALPLCCLILWAGLSGFPFALRSALLLPVLQGPWTSLLLWLLVFLTGMLTAGNLWVLHRRSGTHWRTIMGIVLRIGAALLITATAVGLRGKYYPHYFGFAVPVVTAIFALSLRSAIRLPPQIRRTLLTTATILAAVAIVLLPSQNPFFRPLDTDERRRQDIAAAARFDTLLESCQQNRYLAYGEETQHLWAFTRHTPYGSSFSHMTWTADRTSPAFRALYEQRFQETSIIVLDPWRLPELEHERNGTLWSVFSRDPPPCAAPFLPVNEYRKYLLLFRRT